MNRKYIPSYKAWVIRDDMRAEFFRLHVDDRDVMSDSPRPSWTAVDDFLIKLKKYGPAKGDIKDVVEEYRITVFSKDTANLIWLFAKRGVTFDRLKKMHQDGKF